MNLVFIEQLDHPGDTTRSPLVEVLRTTETDVEYGKPPEAPSRRKYTDTVKSYAPLFSPGTTTDVEPAEILEMTDRSFPAIASALSE